MLQNIQHSLYYTRLTAVTHKLRRGRVGGETEVDVPPQRNHVPIQHSVLQRHQLEIHSLSHSPDLKVELLADSKQSKVGRKLSVDKYIFWTMKRRLGNTTRTTL